MYPTDPHSTQQIRRAQLMDAERRNRFARWGEPPSLRQQIRSAWQGTRAHAVLDPTHELFAGLDRRSLKRLEQRLTVADLASGHSLLRQGEPSTKFVVVVSGQIGVTIDELPVAVFDTGSHFGALALLADGADPLAAASFRTMVPTRVAEADAEQFRSIIADFPLIGLRVRSVAARRRAYLQGHAHAKQMHADRIRNPFPVHAMDGF